MTHKALKLGVAGVILAGAVTYLALQGVQSGWHYEVGVDQYLAQTELYGKRVRLAGTVSEEDFKVQKAGLSADFYILGQNKRLRVAYKGTVPDLFKVGSPIVIEGKQDAAGVFESDLLMTKCASKYEDMAKSSTMASTQPSISGDNSGLNGDKTGAKP